MECNVKMKQVGAAVEPAKVIFPQNQRATNLTQCFIFFSKAHAGFPWEDCIFVKYMNGWFLWYMHICVEKLSYWFILHNFCFVAEDAYQVPISRTYMQHNSIETFDSLFQQLPLHSGGIQPCYFVDRHLLFCSPKSQPFLVNLWLVMLVWHYGIWQWKWWWTRECTIDSSFSQSSRSVFCQWVVCWWASLCIVMLKSYDFLGWNQERCIKNGRPLELVHPGFFRPNLRLVTLYDFLGWIRNVTFCRDDWIAHLGGSNNPNVW